MKIGIKLLIILLSIYSSVSLYGQNNKLDSLWNEYKQAKHDTTRIKLYLDIGNIYKSEKPDTALIFYQKAYSLSIRNIKLNTTNKKKFISLEATSLRQIGNAYDKKENFDKAIEYNLKALKLFKVVNDQYGMAACYNNIGIANSVQGNYDKALENDSAALKIFEELSKLPDKTNGIKKAILGCYNSIGIVYASKGNYNNSLAYFLKALKIYEEIEDIKGISDCYANIGIIYYYIKDYDKAIDYYFKALKISESLGNKNVMIACYLNIGTAYSSKKLYNKELEYDLKALRISEEIGDKSNMSACYGNIGTIYQLQGNYDKSIEYYQKDLRIAEELGDKYGIGLCYVNMCWLNQILADSAALNENQRLNYLNKAIEYGTKAIDLAQEIKALQMENNSSKSLMVAYESIGNNKLALKYAKILIATKDSMFSEEKTKSLAEMGTKYEAEKKQLEIEKMQKQKELDNKTIEAQTAENRKQQIIIFSAIGGFLIVLIFSIIILRMFRQKRKANILLAVQNTEIRQQKEEISAQRDEIEAQRDTVVIQKNNIEEQKKEITDSINYAKRIQQAVLPSGSYANNILGEHFILFKPKDIVSGDFYWGTRVNEWLIVTVADCTGHGVPGAFMSMLGVSFLNEIVRKKEITKASEVLDHLRESIIEALQQKGQSGEQKDGMDMALCVINTLDKSLQFAGANNPLFIITPQKEFREISPDKQPVAIYENMKPYTNQVINLQKGDTIYLTSDGYEDQFGGPKNKKFMAKQLKELFVNITDKPMNEQREILNTTFENWKGIHEQIDDVTILGLRI